MSELLDRNLAHLLAMHAPVERDGGKVDISYGYNSGGAENYVYFITADCGVLAIGTVIAEIDEVDFTDSADKQWHIIGFDVNYEDTELRDDHTGKLVPSMYGED